MKTPEDEINDAITMARIQELDLYETLVPAIRVRDEEVRRRALADVSRWLRATQLVHGECGNDAAEAIESGDFMQEMKERTDVE